MSNYRDDSQETMVITDKSIGRMTSITDEFISIATALIIGVTVFHSDTVVASDEVMDSRRQIIQESISVHDSLIDSNATSTLIKESIKIIDQDKSILRTRTNFIDEAAIADFILSERVVGVLSDSVGIADFTSGSLTTSRLTIDKLKVQDSVISNSIKESKIYVDIAISDAVFDSVRTITKDTLNISDLSTGKKLAKVLVKDSVKISDDATSRIIKSNEVIEQCVISDLVIDKVFSVITDTVKMLDQEIGQRTAFNLITEKAKPSDKLVGGVVESIVDTLVISDSYKNINKAKILIVDTLQLQDDLQQQVKFKQLVSDLVKIKSSVLDRLIAQSIIRDIIFIDDLITDNAAIGYAWTANTDNWAMSRYQDYKFDELVVINNVLHGINDLGVHKINVPKFIGASITTGNLDIGNGNLVHPLAAYLEYELSGLNKSLEVGVTTMQSGNSETYYYSLPVEPANQLTNGRVIFGRGLRGRHFSFDIKINGEHGYINDLRIDVAATKRRV